MILIFSDEDLEWVDQVDREAVVVTIAVEEARVQGEPVQDTKAKSDGYDSDDEDYEDEDEDDHVVEAQTQTQGERMALVVSMTYLRCTRRKTQATMSLSFDICFEHLIPWIAYSMDIVDIWQLH